MFFISEISLDKYTISYERSVYGILDLIGELGGVYELFFISLGWFLNPWSNVTFYLKAVEKLYYVRTKKLSLFKQSHEIEEHKQ